MRFWWDLLTNKNRGLFHAKIGVLSTNVYHRNQSIVTPKGMEKRIMSVDFHEFQLVWAAHHNLLQVPARTISLSP